MTDQEIRNRAAIARDLMTRLQTELNGLAAVGVHVDMDVNTSQHQFGNWSVIHLRLLVEKRERF